MLTEAMIEEVAKVLWATTFEDEDAPPAWDEADEEDRDRCRAVTRTVMAAGEKVIRERASNELVAWAEEIPDGDRRTGSRATRYRTLMAAARKVLPKMTLQQVGEALAAGHYMASYRGELEER